MATWEYQVEAFTPTPGAIPADGSDSLGNYTGWELSDEVTFTFTVPTGYTAGAELVFRIHEATASVSKNHVWAADVTLNGGTPESFSEEYTAGLVADTLTLRTLTISTSGTIDSVAISGGDLVAVTLTRSAAAANEDSNNIRLYSLMVTASVADTSYNDCGGRTGKIIDAVLDLYRDGTHQDFLTAVRVLRYMNECLKEIAQAGYFTEEGTIDVVASQERYELETLFPSIVAPLDIWWTDSKIPLSRQPRRSTLNELRKTISGISANADWYSLCWFQDGLGIEVAPVPTTAWSAGWTLRYSYLPDEIGCETNFDPPTPAVFDDMYVNYAMRKTFQLDRGGRRAMDLFRLYNELYQRDRNKLLRNTRNAIIISR